MPELPVANFSSADLAALSVEGVETFKASMAKAGFDTSAIESAISQRGAPTSNVGLTNSPDLGLSPAQREAAIANLEKFWSGDQSVIEGLRGAQTAGDGPDPNSYKLSYGQHAALAEDNLASLDREFRTGFAAAGIPQSHAQPLVDAILSTLDTYAPGMTPEAAEDLRRQHEMSAFHRLPGSDELLRYAQLAYKALPESLLDLLNEHGALNSAQAYVALSNIGRQLEYNFNRKGKP